MANKNDLYQSEEMIENSFISTDSGGMATNPG